MAYSDYGGYAYRNGVRVESRSDCTITPEGDTFGTPGMWPGFAMALAGMDAEEITKRREWPNGHAVLGDGPIFVTLYKQSSTGLYRGPIPIELIDLPGVVVEEWTDKEGVLHCWVDTDHYKNSGEPLRAEVDGWTLTVYYEITDNHYQYAELRQPDGIVWHGWSGYGVGAGLEDAGYGFSTDDCEARLWELFAQPKDTTHGE